jgi:hypothetical protein
MGRKKRIEAGVRRRMTMPLDWILFGVTVYAVLMFALMLADARWLPMTAFIESTIEASACAFTGLV